MADRYQDRPFSADDYDRGGDPRASARGESDPLAELARLIGQTDPFGTTGRANQPVTPRTTARDPYPQPPEPEPELEDDAPPAGPPPWMQRANRQEIQRQDPPQDYPSSVHPLQRYATPRAAPAPGYEEEPEDVATKRGGGMFPVVVVFALAVVGTGVAFAYRTYVGTPRSGEPPIIRADAGPTKIVPGPSDGSAKVPDRMSAGDGTEKIVPREEAPVDVNARAGQAGVPRRVFPQPNPNGNPPSMARAAPTG